MYNVDVKCGEYVGPIKLGMTRKEVKELSHTIPYLISLDIGYDESDRIVEIQIINDRSINPVLVDYGYEVFQTKVEELIPMLEQISPFARDKYYSEGLNWDFPLLGLRVWRSNEVYSKDLDTEEFRNQDPDEQEYMSSFLYCETIVIFTPRNMMRKQLNAFYNTKESYVSMAPFPYKCMQFFKACYLPS